MKESDFMVIYNYDKYQDYKFEYKKIIILVKKLLQLRQVNMHHLLL